MVVGLVGCGRWGRHILRDLMALECEVPVVARSHESRGRAEEGGARVIVGDVGSLPSLDAVVVATTTSTHAEVLESVLPLGVPVYCEKPLTNDPVAGEALARAAPERLFVMDKWRYHPGIAELSRIASDQGLGPPVGLTTVRIGWGLPHDDVDAVWVLAPHDLSIALEVTGTIPRPRSAVGQSENGRLLSLSALLDAGEIWHAFTVSTRSPVRSRRVELVCERGIAILADAWDEHISVFAADAAEPEEQRIETPGELPLLACLRAFVEHVRGGPPPKSTAAEAAAGVAVLAQLREQAERS